MDTVVAFAASSVFTVPLLIVGGILVVVAVCACCRCYMWCVRSFSIRDCHCIKSCLRCIGTDRADDMELMFLVHEAIFTSKTEKLETYIRLTAGRETVQTDNHSHSVYQQSLTIFVEQGTEVIKVDLLDSKGKLLATLTFDLLTDIINNQASLSEKVHPMKSKSKYVGNPKVKLSIVLDDDDAETGLLRATQMTSETAWVVKQRLRTLGSRPSFKGQECNEMFLLQHVCSGALELFGGMGNSSNCYVGVLGPPRQRKFVLGIWPNQHEFEKDSKPMKQVDLLKVRSVQSDPKRDNVFHIYYFDKDRVAQQMYFRRIDRTRNSWIEMLQLLIKMVHADAQQTGKKTIQKS